jgi:hypothetical protein
MNLRCIYCQTPFTLARTEMLSAIVQMNERNMNHYDAHCPRCRRANSISRQRMELFLPNWQEAIKHQPPTPVMAMQPSSSSSAPASASLKTEPVSKAQKAAVAKKTTTKPAVKPAAKKPSVKKTTAPAKKTTTKTKPAGKKAPAKGKKK